jgi:hypothetical protein
VGLEHEERLTEACQRQQACDHDHPPERCWQGGDVTAADWAPALVCVVVEGQFLDSDEQHDDRKIGRDQRDPKYQTKIIAAQFHQDDRDKRPHHETGDGKCQAQAKSGAPDLLGGEIR